MKFTLYLADTVGSRSNCVYPRQMVVESEEMLRAAVSFDHVCAEYEGNRRSNKAFLSSDVVVMDVDNDHSDSPEEWITQESLLEEYADLDFAAAASRSNMKPKNGRSPRPRFHVYFRIAPIQSSAAYADLKAAIHRVWPFFDPNALDAGRFLFGCRPEETLWHEGGRTIESLLAGMRPHIDSIPEGRRNATLSRVAGRLVKRYGVNEQSYHMFLAQAARCDPPLEEQELGTIWRSATRFARKVQTQPGYIPPELYEATLKPSDYSDIGQAKVLAMDCGGELVYTEATDFLCYNGTSWVESRQRAVGLVEEFLDRQLDDAESILSASRQALLDAGINDEALRAGGKTLERAVPTSMIGLYTAYRNALTYQAFVMKRRDIRYITSALQAVRPMVQLDARDLDRDENLLNCPDGTYDLRIGLGGRRDHDPFDLITKITPYAPGPEGEELWQQTLRRTFCDDSELIDYVNQIVGLCAIGAVYQEALIIAYGDGQNGKSTFWNTISGALGNYAGAISADTLTIGCRRNVKPELAEVKGKRLLIAAELEEGTRLSTSIVKQLCSTDEISAEKKYKDPFKFRPTHTLVLYTNHLPKVGAMDTGIWRRLIVIPFRARIQGKGDIKNYSKYLLEHAGPAITAWIIDGARKAIEADFHLKFPLSVQAAIEQYRADNDWMTHFLEACCVVEDGREEKSGELYTAYRSYCARSGEYARSTTEFYNTLDQRGFLRTKTRAGVIVRGLELCDFTA